MLQYLVHCTGNWDKQVKKMTTVAKMAAVIMKRIEGCTPLVLLHRGAVSDADKSCRSARDFKARSGRVMAWPPAEIYVEQHKKFFLGGGVCFFYNSPPSCFGVNKDRVHFNIIEVLCLCAFGSVDGVLANRVLIGSSGQRLMLIG